MKALAFSTFGEPEVLRYIDVPAPELKAGSLIVRTLAAGLNFADIYRRRGNYSITSEAPHVLGFEGAGIVEAVAADVTDFNPGDKVGFADVPFANATHVRVPANQAIALGASISPVTAAAMLLQGLTAQYLCEDSAMLRPGDRVAIHAAAGGVGRLLVQFCKAAGAQVHALVSSPAKAHAARVAGADATYLSSGDWVRQVRDGSGGGVNVVFDSVGSTLAQSLSILRPRGRVVLYGFAGGEPPVVAPRDLMENSLGIIGGDLWSYLDSRDARRQRCARLFDALDAGVITVPPIETFALHDGAAAHRRLESRELIGKIVLVPDDAHAQV
jgi:NADPH2:quinone reductase